MLACRSHLIEEVARENGLRPLPCWTARSSAIADDRLVPKNAFSTRD